MWGLGNNTTHFYVKLTYDSELYMAFISLITIEVNSFVCYVQIFIKYVLRVEPIGRHLYITYTCK